MYDNQNLSSDDVEIESSDNIKVSNISETVFDEVHDDADCIQLNIQINKKNFLDKILTNYVLLQYFIFCTFKHLII